MSEPTAADSIFAIETLKRVSEGYDKPSYHAQRLAAYREAAALPVWQPIGTAPRDNTPLIGRWGNTVSLIRYIGIGPTGWYSPGAQPTCDVDPTHWMPLPAPPAP